MTTDNLDIWVQGERSDPKYLKKVSFGARSFTAIDPHYQIKLATQIFGPVGDGWGWHANMEHIQLSNGDMALLSHVTVWHGDRGNEYGPFSGCRKFFDAAKGRTAEDAPKMATTDGLTKALSHLGINADVFLGEQDGNKYAADSDAGKKGGEGW